MKIFLQKTDNSQNNQEAKLENKLQSRQEQFSNEENFSQIKESTISQELSLGENNLNKIFLQKRLNKITNNEKNQRKNNPPKNHPHPPYEPLSFITKLIHDISGEHRRKKISK